MCVLKMGVCNYSWHVRARLWEHLPCREARMALDTRAERTQWLPLCYAVTSLQKCYFKGTLSDLKFKLFKTRMQSKAFWILALGLPACAWHFIAVN